MNKLFMLLSILVVSLSTKAQQKEVLGTSTAVYSQLGEVNAPGNVEFSMQYKVFAYAGLRVSFAPSIFASSHELIYYYKGKSYMSTNLPELKSIRIKGFRGTVEVSNSKLDNKIIKSIDAMVGGNNSALGENSIVLADKIPDGFFGANTTVNFTVTNLLFDASEANAAIERHLAKEKEAEQKKASAVTKSVTQSTPSTNKAVVTNTANNQKSTPTDNTAQHAAKRTETEAEKQTRAQQEAAQIMANLEREQAERERQRQIDQQKITQATTDMVQVGTALFQGIAADKEAARQARYRSTSTAKTMLSENLSAAKSGNIEALKQVNSAYNTLAYHNDEYDRGWQGEYSDAQKKLLHTVLGQTGSKEAKGMLVTFYEYQKQYEIDKHKKARNRLIWFPLLGSGMIYGSTFLFGNLEDGATSTTNTIVGSAAVVGGGVLGLWGLLETINVFQYGKRSNDYQEADNMIKALNKTYSFNLYPTYDLQTKQVLVGMSLRF